MSLHHERGPMITDDLRALPRWPLTIAEGTPVTPPAAHAYGRAHGRSVWLLPTPEFQRARLRERGIPPEEGAFRLLPRSHLRAVTEPVRKVSSGGSSSTPRRVPTA